MKNDHALHAFTITVFLINFRPKLPHCHDFQKTGSKCLKLGIQAPQCINRKQITGKDYLPIGYDFLSILLLKLCK